MSRSGSAGLLALAIVEPYDDAPDVCTIYSTAFGDSTVESWVSAEEGSYESLRERR